MPQPAAGWHHDGRGSLAALVRWVDLEGAAEADLERYDPEWTAPQPWSDARFEHTSARPRLDARFE